LEKAGVRLRALAPAGHGSEAGTGEGTSGGYCACGLFGSSDAGISRRAPPAALVPGGGGVAGLYMDLLG
jgi:hypothetical protein